MKMWNQAQVRARLAEKAKSMGLRMPQMQGLLAQERFLARLASLPEGSKYVYKGGGLILRLYQGLEIPRYTVDIDLLAKGISMERTKEIFNNAFAVELHDGFKFLSITSVPMERETPYGGERLEIEWRMFGKAQSAPLRIDVCAGDVVDDVIIKAQDLFIYPENIGEVSLHVYSAEYIFAEKLETVFRFETGNTRLKDLIDMWGLIRKGLDYSKLKAAIVACFANRDQKFDLKKLQAILGDADYQRLMEDAKNRNFGQLKLPLMSEIAQVVLQAVTATKI